MGIQTNRLNEDLVSEIRSIINSRPYCGLRRIHWYLNRDREKPINTKAVRRILELKGWLIIKRPKGMRPRAEGWNSKTTKPDGGWI